MVDVHDLHRRDRGVRDRRTARPGAGIPGVDRLRAWPAGEEGRRALRDRPRQYQATVDQAKAAVQAQEAALAGAENDARLARELADQQRRSGDRRGDQGGAARRGQGRSCEGPGRTRRGAAEPRLLRPSPPRSTGASASTTSMSETSSGEASRPFWPRSCRRRPPTSRSTCSEDRRARVMRERRAFQQRARGDEPGQVEPRQPGARASCRSRTSTDFEIDGTRRLCRPADECPDRHAAGADRSTTTPRTRSCPGELRARPLRDVVTTTRCWFPKRRC